MSIRKKMHRLCLITPLLLTLSAPQANAFTAENHYNGFYLGYETGVDWMRFTCDSNNPECLGYTPNNYVPVTPQGRGKANNGKYHYTGQGDSRSNNTFIGYNQVFDHFYLGVEGGISFFLVEGRLPDNTRSPEDNPRVALWRAATLDIIPGYVMDDATLLYGRIGRSAADVQRRTARSPDFLSPQYELDVDANGLHLGLGVQKPFLKHWDVRAEVSHTHYPNLQLHEARVSPNTVGVSVGLVLQ